MTFPYYVLDDLGIALIALIQAHWVDLLEVGLQTWRPLDYALFDKRLPESLAVNARPSRSGQLVVKLWIDYHIPIWLFGGSSGGRGGGRLADL